MRVFFFLICLVASTVISAQGADDSKNTLYRFKNASGVWELSNQLSPEAYQSGYQVLEGGQVVETVAPPPTDAQLKERAVAEELDSKKKAQEFKDQQLLKTYSSVADATRARDRKINQMQVMTEITQARINQMKSDNEKLVADAANAQQLGLSVYDTIINRLHVNEQEVLRLQQFNDGKYREMQVCLEEYQVIIDRLQYLQEQSTQVTSISTSEASTPVEAKQ